MQLSCIMRCVTSIMAVLGLTEGTTPSADDLTPVLVYVILKVCFFYYSYDEKMHLPSIAVGR